MGIIGKTLDKYEIVAGIGSGGMATVYRAYQPNLERYVAVKVLSAQLASDPTFRQRFDREAKEAARLSHPHILPVYDSGEYEGTVYIVTEFVEGGSLKHRMAHPLEPGVAARIAHDIALALDYAHCHGLVPRDVKPGNVLMTRNGRTLLADFGIAKVVSGTPYTQTGMAVGTPAYMSPEQARGEEVDGRSDLLLASREAGAPSPTATPALPPSPTLGPTAVPTGILEVRNRVGTGLVLEIHGQQWKVGAGESVELTLPAGEHAYSFRVQAPDYAPGMGSVTVVAGHNVLTIQAGPTATPLLRTATATAPAGTPKPGTVRHTSTPSVTPTRAPRCPNPGVRITSPGVDAALRGQVTVRGSASIPGFSYYKLELGAGSAPKEWAVLGPLQCAPVVDGILGTWDTGARPAGTYVLRLAVVDNTGNFEVCDVSVQIAR